MTDAKGRGYRQNRMFDVASRQTRGGAVTHGFMVGCVIAVIMLAFSMAAEAASGDWDEGLTFCLSYLVAGVAGGILQQMWFSPHVIERLSYLPRIIGFAVTYYIVLAACALAGGWMPADSMAFVEFTITFALITAAITASFTIRMRREGGTYDELLAEYRRRQRKDSAGE